MSRTLGTATVQVLRHVAALAFIALLGLSSAHAVNCVSGGSGTWTTISWGASCPADPAAGDTVTIQAGHTVTLNTTASMGSLSIAGTLTFGNNNSARTLTVSGNLSNTGTINISANNNLHTLNVGGNISNSGTLDFWDSASRAINLTLNGTALQTISGGGVFTFNNVIASNSTTIDSTVTATAAASITVLAAKTVTNNGSIVAANVAGNASTSVWTQGSNSSLEVSGTLMTVGVLNASATGNTVYYNANAAQAIKLPTGGDYFHLRLGGGNTKTPAAGTYDVLGDLTVEAATTMDVNTSDPIINVTGDTSIAGTYAGSNTAALTMTGDFSVSGTYTGNGGAANLAGNFNRSGTFTSGAGVFTFNSTTAVQTISGSPAFTNLTINNTGGGITLNSDVTATVAPGTGTLVLQNGTVATGAFNLITSRNCSGPSVSRTNGWVNGNLRKAIPAGASTCTFEIGDANSYAPVVMVFAAGTTAGTLTGKTTGGDHPSISSASIQANDSVNRYWTFTAGGALTVPGGYSATFNFPSTDADNAGAIGTYIVQQWTGTLWFPTTLAASCTATPATHVCKQITGELQFGDFAIGGVAAGFNPNPGAFNIFETNTTSGSILGRIYTKVAGETAIQLSIVAVSNNGVNASPSATSLTVDVIDANDSSGALNSATNCRSTWPSGSFIQRQTVSASWTSGRLTFTLTTPTQALRDARIRVTQGALVGCSTDRFSIRPDMFTISSTASNSTASGTPTIKTGVDFTITAQPVTKAVTPANITAGYNGAPNFDNTKILVPAGYVAGTIAGSFNAATGGAASGTGFYYNEVGNFGLAADAATDNTFTGVDQTTDCIAGSSTNTMDLVTGKVGCSIGSSASSSNSTFGRFIPDNFDVSLNDSLVRLGAACGTFTYVGQRFAYSVAPVVTVTAKSGNNHSLGNTTTRNYSGVYMKLTNSSLAGSPYDTQAGRYTRFDAGSTPTLSFSSSFPTTAGDPSITFASDATQPNPGIVTLTFGTGLAGEGFFFTRDASTPSAPFNADIALGLIVVDGDDVRRSPPNANAAVLFGAASSGGGMAFTGGNAMRYGIVRLLDAYAPLSGTGPVTIRSEYWNGSAFALNTLDNCTSFTEENFVLHTHRGSITAANLPTPTSGVNGKVSMGVATLSSGVGRVNVINPSLAPAPINTITAPGNVRICLDLDSASSPVDNSCVAPTPADRAYLQGRWAPSTYERDPYGTVGFGLYGAQPRNFIFMRENY